MVFCQSQCCHAPECHRFDFIAIQIANECAKVGRHRRLAFTRFTITSTTSPLGSSHRAPVNMSRASGMKMARKPLSFAARSFGAAQLGLVTLLPACPTINRFSSAMEDVGMWSFQSEAPAALFVARSILASLVEKEVLTKEEARALIDDAIKDCLDLASGRSNVPRYKEAGEVMAQIRDTDFGQ